MITIVMPVHNQQDLIPQVLQGIWDNSSPLVNELVIIIDGCTDLSETVIRRWIPVTSNINVVILHADNVYETKADNMGLKAATQPYVGLNQDDCIPDEKDWDKRLLLPFQKWDDVFAVTGRMSLDTKLSSGGQLMYNDGTSWTNLDRNTFAVRDVVNRGPLMLRLDRVKELGYLDEAYAPLFMDDCDIVTRAWIQHKWVSGAFPIQFKSELAWGTTRKGNAQQYGLWERDHMALYIRRYKDFITGPKHSENRRIDD